ncbi:MAG: M20/M25/M40 family metallo-hydrolase, partial [Planctomycetota bacterium]
MSVPREEEAQGGLLAALVSAAVLIAIVLLFTRGAPLPKPKAADALATEFSAERAHTILEEICREPHPVGSPALRGVQSVLVDRLVDLGFEPEIQERSVEYSWWPTGARRQADLVNLWVEVRGTHQESLGAVFVCHYDSREGSPGATDDGAAVATFLEVLSALKARPALPRTIAFLFTDGEEAGLLGAEAFCSEEEEGEWGRRRDRMLRSLAVFNFDAIGNAGPSILFETAKDSGPLVAELPLALDRVYASSLGPTVYERMPNGTDFTIFKDGGARGLNSPVVGGKGAYHAPFDVPANQPLGVLQCQGDTVLGLATHFGSLPLWRERMIKKGGERVFFDLFGYGFVHYRADLNAVLG